MKNKTLKHFMYTMCAISFLLTACGEMSQQSSQSSNSDNIDNDKDTKPDQLCYNGNKVCLKASKIATIASMDSNYKYPNYKDFPDKSQQALYKAPAMLLALNTAVEAKSISKNFSVGEFMSSAKGKFGLVTPALVATLQDIRDTVRNSVHITSGYRSPGYNSAVDGSAKWSRHTYGDAVDLQIPSVSLNRIKQLCEEQDASFVLVYTAHVHCDWRLVSHAAERVAQYKIIAGGRIDSVASNDGGVDLVVNGLQSEDPEEQLIYEWRIEYPDGSLKTFSGSSVHLSSPQGQYKVSVTVGMTVEIDEVFVW